MFACCHNSTAAAEQKKAQVSQQFSTISCCLVQESKTVMEALAGWLSWLESHPINQNATGSIPGQAHAQFVRSVPRWG